MDITIPQAVIEIYNKLETSGFQIYFVGGCVRNILLNKPVKDWDLTTNATPEAMLEIFPDAFYDNQFGTVGIPVSFQFSALSSQQEVNQVSDSQSDDLKTEHPETENRKPIIDNWIVEITTFRSESGYSDRRHPEQVTWGKTIEEDLERRDFTINAIAMQLTCHPGEATTSIGSLRNDTKKDSIPAVAGLQNDNIHLIDPFNGQADLQQSIIRAVGNPSERFKEDALRLMRAVRFATQLGFVIEEQTWHAMQEDAALLASISAERIHDELLKMLASDHPYEGIMLLKNAKLLDYILPELLEGIDVSQERPGRHHTTDVFTHNVMSLKECPSTDPVVRFATLIHDVGKPRVRSEDENGYVIFYNHEIMGSRMAYDICDRLRFSKKDKAKIVKLIRWHMFTVDEHITDAAVRRFIRRIGVDNVKDMMDLRIGDRLGGGTQTAESWRLKLFKQRIDEQLQPAPFSVNDLAVDGNDVMKELNIKPGKQIGVILQKLFEEVDENLELNTKEYLIKRIHDIAQSS